MSLKAFRPRQAAVPAAALVVGALALSACGGSGSSAASSTPSSTPSSTQGSTTTTGGTATAFAAYSSCLKQHGVTLPNFANRRPGGGAPPANGGGNPPANGSGRGGFGGFGGSPAARKKFQAAQTACAKLRPKGSFGGGRGGGFFGGGGGANSTAFAAYRNCLTIHGVAFGRRSAGGAPAAPNISTAKMKAALTACASLRPAGFGRRPPASSSSGSG